MLGVVLLYVGAVLFVNGIWLFGLARAQAREQAAAPVGAPTRLPASLMIDNKDVAVINIFTGSVNSVVAVIALVFGVIRNDVALYATAGYVLLFGFTYLWVAINQFTGVTGRGLGWFCLFVAVTAVPVGLLTLATSGGSTLLVWLGLDWLAWSVLWFLYFLLLAQGRPVLRLTAAVTVVEAVLTAWLLGFLLLTEQIPGLVPAA